jgi:hypothetical protein
VSVWSFLMLLLSAVCAKSERQKRQKSSVSFLCHGWLAAASAALHLWHKSSAEESEGLYSVPTLVHTVKREREKKHSPKNVCFCELFFRGG